MPYPDPNHYKSPLKRARETGAAKSGTHHWWLIKVTAVALIPLTLWFFFSLLHIVTQGGGYEEALAWVQFPLNGFLLSVLLGVNFYHAAIAGQEVIVDYVPNHRIQIPAALLYRLVCYGFGLLSVFSVLYICFRA